MHRLVVTLARVRQQRAQMDADARFSAQFIRSMQESERADAARAAREPPWKDWGFRIGGQWVWARGKEPPPGLFGMPPEPPAVEPTGPEATSERHGFGGWIRSWDEHQRQGFALLLFLVATVLAVLIVLLRELVLRSVLAAAYFGAGAVLLWLLSTLPRRSRVLWLTVGSVLVVTGASVITWLLSTQGVHNESSGNAPTAEATFRLSPVMTHHPVFIEYADIDGTGRRIYVRDRLDNTTNDVITYTHYGKAILARPARTEEDALTLLEPLKDEVRRLASGGGAVVSALEPMAGNAPIYILGPHATEKQWHDFLAGRTSLYFDDLIYPKLADKRRFHLEECGIARAAKYVFDVPPCPKRGTPEEI